MSFSLLVGRVGLIIVHLFVYGLYYPIQRKPFCGSILRSIYSVFVSVFITEEYGQRRYSGKNVLSMLATATNTLSMLPLAQI